MSEAAPSGMRSSLASGARWSVVGMGGRQVGRFLTATTLAVILGPNDYGIIAQAVTYVTLTEVFIDYGFGSALIQKRALADEDAGSVTWVNIVAGVAMAALTLVVAPAVALFFHTPALTGVLRALAVALLLKALAVVPTALLTRELRFRSLATAQVAGIAVGGVAGISAALAGASYWSFVIQVVVHDGVYLAVALIATGRLHLRWSTRSLRSMLGFSSSVLGHQLLSYTSRNLDYILIGRFLGTAPLAFYAIAFRVQQLPVRLLGQAINTVAFPSFAKLQDDRPWMRRQFLAISRLSALVMFPLMALVMVSAPDLVPLVLGEQWRPAILPMQALAVVAMRRSTTSCVQSVLFACGRANWRLRLSVVTVVMTTLAILAGLPGGIDGVAISLAVGDLLIMPVGVLVVGRLVDLRLVDYLRGLAPAALVGAVLAATWLSARAGLAWIGASQILAVALATLVSVPVTWWAMRAKAPDDLSTLRSLARRRQPDKVGNTSAPA